MARGRWETRFIVAGALLGASLLGTSPASAYCRSTTCIGHCPRNDDGCKITGYPLFWRSVCAGWSFQRDGTVNLPRAESLDAIQKAFEEWSNVKCPDGAGFASLTNIELADVTCNRQEYNSGAPNANIVLFEDNKWTYAGSDNSLARTLVTFSHDTGEILDVDIEINYAYNEFTVADDNVVYDLQSVVAHEVGHFVGLDHTPDPEATMNAGYSPGSIEFRTLKADDIAGACSIYVPRRKGTCNATPRNGLGDACFGNKSTGCAVEAGPEEPSGSWAVPLGLGLLAFGRRRARRAPCV